MGDYLMQYGEVFSIVMFFIPPVLFLTALYFIKRRWIWRECLGSRRYSPVCRNGYNKGAFSRNTHQPELEKYRS